MFQFVDHLDAICDMFYRVYSGENIVVKYVVDDGTASINFAD